MSQRTLLDDKSQIEKRTKDFLEANPRAAKALEMFGISYEKYLRFMEAQRRPTFITSNSTTPGGLNGELDKDTERD